MSRYLLFLIISLFAVNASAQQYQLAGHISDEHNQSIPFVSVYISGTTYGTTANENGNYQFKLNPGTYHVVYRYVGYKEQNESVTITNHDVRLNLKMEDEVFTLKNVIVEGKKIRKDTAAYAIMGRLVEKRDYYLNEIKGYSCAVYLKGVQRLLGAPKAFLGKAVRNTLDLDSMGRGILYQTESISNYNFQQPNSIKELTVASKTVGLAPAFSYTKASDLQVNFYERIFSVPGLSNHGFVSPAGKDAFKYYNYKLTGTTTENGHVIDEIQVIPKDLHSATFRGNIYVLEGDWRLYSVDLYLTNKDNELNFIDTLNISQQYIPIRDSVWEPASVQYHFTGTVFGFHFGGYYDCIYNNYNLNPNFPDKFFTGEILRYDTTAETKSDNYWSINRPVPLTKREIKDYHDKDSIGGVTQSQGYRDSLQHNNNRFLILPYIVFGHSSTYHNKSDSIYLYPFINTLFYNTVEGYGLNVAAKYTHTLNSLQSFDVTPDVRYGFSDKIFTANINGEYNYDPFHNSKFYGGFGTDILDLNNVGTRSLYFNTLSTLLSERNYVKYYESKYGSFGYQRELVNGLLWNVSLTYADRIQLYNTSFNHIETFSNKQYTSNNPLAPNAPADDHSVLFPENQALTFFTSFRYTFDQQYVTRPTGKIDLPSKYPTVTLVYRQGINDVLSSDVDYKFASLTVAQAYMPIGVVGFSAFQVTLGDFFDRGNIYFPDYNHFLGNQGTTFDPTYIGSFHFLPFYTFSTDKAFLEAHYQHNFSGSLLKDIPFMRNLKLDEIVGANYLDEQGNNNYSEFYVGLQRLIFRVDYGVSFEGNKKYMQGIKIFYGIR